VDRRSHHLLCLDHRARARAGKQRTSPLLSVVKRDEGVLGHSYFGRGFNRGRDVKGTKGLEKCSGYGGLSRPEPSRGRASHHGHRNQSRHLRRRSDHAICHLGHHDRL
jgi:hypothetical protein